MGLGACIGRHLSKEMCRHVRTCHTRHDVGMLNKERGGGPKVVLATLASLEAGLARQLFVEWARDSRNLIIFPLQAQVMLPATLAWRTWVNSL